jgi:hypothetical protein
MFLPTTGLAVGENRPGCLIGETGFLDFNRSGSKSLFGNENVMAF